MPFVKHSDVADGGNGAATNCHDFIVNKMIPFITSSNHFPVAADRWTLERTDAVATNEVEIFISPPSNSPNSPVVSFHTRDSCGYMFAGTSPYVAGTESYAMVGNNRSHPEEQSGIPGWADVVNDRHHCSWTNLWPTTGLLAHWLFAPDDGHYCLAIIQMSTRRFRHIFFGEYTKFQAAMGGGEFFGALYWSASHSDEPYRNNRQHGGPLTACGSSLGNGLQTGAFRAEGLRTGATIAPDAEWYNNCGIFNPQDGITRPTSQNSPPWDLQNNAAEDVGRGWINAQSRSGPGNSLLFQIQQSLISNIKPLLPITVWASGFAEGQDRWMPAGQIDDVFRIHLLGFTPAQDLVVGSDTYSLFPFINSDQVNTLSGDEYSGFEGLAIRQRL